MPRIKIPADLPRRPPAANAPGGRAAARKTLYALGGVILLLAGLLGALTLSAPGREGRHRAQALPPPTAARAVPPAPREAAPPVRAAEPARPVPGGGPRMAILIDDMGYSLKAARELLAIDLPIAFAVLPHLAHSRQVALEAKLRGRQLLLHMPLEPLDYPRVEPGPGGLLLSQPPEEWRRRARAALDDVPGISGVNNHMGSRFTERADAMEIILGEVRARGLFFVDSYTTPQSIAHDVARRLGVRTGRRTVFLDNEADEAKILAQIDRLIAEAKETGRAFGIGHPHKETIAALRRGARRIRESGVRVVPPGEALE